MLCKLPSCFRLLPSLALTLTDSVSRLARCHHLTPFSTSLTSSSPAAAEGLSTELACYWLQMMSSLPALPAAPRVIG
ncbi:uncharacterized [Tachysurus ichikawai]